MENFSTFGDFKQYGTNRLRIRFDGFGFTNTRIHNFPFKKLKGFIKQLDHFKEINTTIDAELYNLVSKEIEFREMCLSMRPVFDIKIR